MQVFLACTGDVCNARQDMRTVRLKRIRALQAAMRRQKLQALLVMCRENYFYLSGFTGSRGSLLVTRRGALLYVDGRYTLQARQESVVPVSGIDRLARALARHQSKIVGVEDTTSLREMRELKRRHRGARWRPVRDAVEKLRSQKDRAELQAIRAGSRLIDAAWYVLRKVIASKKAVTEIELAELLARYGREHGAQGLAFEPVIAWGPHAAAPHHAPSAQKIGRDNFLLLDFGFTVDGYQSDFTRTLFIGRPTARQRELYEAVRAAQQRALAAVHVGARASAVDRAARGYLAERGLAGQFTHNSGHGVGLEIHEVPTLGPDEPSRLPENAVVTVEPGVYMPGSCGIRIEDMVLVRQRPQVYSTIAKYWTAMVID